MPRLIDTLVGLVCHEVLVSSPLSMLTFDTGFNFEWLSSNYAGQKKNKKNKQEGATISKDINSNIGSSSIGIDFHSELRALKVRRSQQNGKYLRTNMVRGISL